MQSKNKIIYVLSGLFAGLLNGLLGAGGGMILVPMLSKSGMQAKEAHANSVAVILFICMFSAFLYIRQGNVSVSDSYPYLIWGVLGSILGAVLLTKIKDIWLKRIFGLLMIWAAVRMLMR